MNLLNWLKIFVTDPHSPEGYRIRADKIENESPEYAKCLRSIAEKLEMANNLKAKKQ